MKTRSIKKALPRLARTTILLLIALILPANLPAVLPAETAVGSEGKGT